MKGNTMKTICANTRILTKNHRRPVKRRWTISRLSERTLDIIDTEAAKWRISRSSAIERIVTKVNDTNRKEVAV